MVSLYFKLSSLGKVELAVTEPVAWPDVLEECRKRHGVETSGLLAVRAGKVLGQHDMVSQGDVIEVFPAISGG